MSARYVFTFESDGKLELYLESTSDEEKLDMDFENVSEREAQHLSLVAVDWTGNGWLAFWKRCMESVMEWRRGHGMRDGTCHAYDNWYDKERSW